VAASIAGAMFTLTILLVTLAGIRTKAQFIRSHSSDDPDIEAITVTSNLPVSDTRPYAGVSKAVYFNNAISGFITLTFKISGVPTLTLIAGAAFKDPKRIYTSTSSPLITDVVYEVNLTHGSQSGIVYTATDGNGSLTTVLITYTRDVTAPTACIVTPPPGYFTDTELTIAGTAQDNDGGAGVKRVSVMTDTTWEMAQGAANWIYTATLPIADGVLLTISARAEDYLGISQYPVATRSITLDNVRPSNPTLITTTNGLRCGIWIATDTVPVTWNLVTDGSGLTY